MKNKILILIIGVLLISNMALLAMYVMQDNKPAKPRLERGPADFMIKELGFDSTQAISFRKLLEEHRTTNRPAMDSLRRIKETFYRYLSVDPIPDSLVSASAKQIGEQESVIALNNFNHFRKVRNLCADSQRVKLDTFLQKIARRSSEKRRH